MTRRIGVLAGMRLLAVFAHPDDESLACGGTLAMCAAEGARVSLLCATLGEAGRRSPGCSEDVGLGAVRRAELHEASRSLGIDEVILLDHPDGSMNGVDQTLFRQEIILTLRHVRPMSSSRSAPTASTGIPITLSCTSASPKWSTDARSLGPRVVLHGVSRRPDADRRRDRAGESGRARQTSRCGRSTWTPSAPTPRSRRSSSTRRPRPARKSPRCGAIAARSTRRAPSPG